MSLYMIASLLEHELLGRSQLGSRGLLISLANQIMHSPHHKAPTDDDLKNAHEFADLALQLALEGCLFFFLLVHIIIVLIVIKNMICMLIQKINN